MEKENDLLNAKKTNSFLNEDALNKDIKSINSSDSGIKFNSINHGKNGFNLFLVDSDGNKLAEGVEKVSVHDKNYLSQTIEAHKIYNIRKVLKSSNVKGEINTLLINIPNDIFNNNNLNNNNNNNNSNTNNNNSKNLNINFNSGCNKNINNNNSININSNNDFHQNKENNSHRDKNISNNITNVNININIQQVEIKENPLEEQIEDPSDSKKGDINFLKKQRNQNFNLNIKEIKEINEKDEPLRDLLTPSNNNQNQIEKASPSKNWRKLSIIFKSLNSFKRYDTKNLVNNEDLDCDLQDYREKLNTLKNKKSTLFSQDCDGQPEFANVRYLSVEEREMYRISVKERILQVIVDGSRNAMSHLHRLFAKNPDGFAKDENDPTHFYNTPLSNGKTLLYVACQEGKTEIVEFFLDKRLNAFVKSKINESEFESCLQVACRWNYLKIVKLLLDKVPYKKEDINEALGTDNLSKNCLVLLKRYLNKFKRNTYCC